MNIRLITVAIFVLIILGALGVFFMNENNTKELTERISPTGQEVQDTEGTEITVRSNDNRVTFTYPSAWMITDTTGTNRRGKFGTIVQSWSVQTSMVTPVAGTPLPENVAEVDIEIESGGSNLSIDDLVDCTMKTITCDKVGIDNEQFIKAETVLNTGLTTITVATFYDSNILRATATVTPGSDQEMLITQVNTILNSFAFSDNNPAND